MARHSTTCHSESESESKVDLKGSSTMTKPSEDAGDGRLAISTSVCAFSVCALGLVRTGR